MATTPPPVRPNQQDAAWFRWVERNLQANAVNLRNVEKRAQATASQVNTIDRQTGQQEQVLTPKTLTSVAPEGLLLTRNEGIWLPDGKTVAALTLQWNTVTMATDGTVEHAAEYEVWIKREEDDDYTRLVATGVTVAPLSLPCDEDIILKVRARTPEGPWGEFSDTLATTTASPPFLLSAPTTPTPLSAVGTVSVEWDGLLADGAPGFDFWYVYAEESTTSGGTYSRVGQVLNGAGGINVTPPVGSTRWYRLRAVDKMGRVSDPSTAASVTVTGIVAGELSSAVNDTIQGAVDAADDAAQLADDAFAAATSAQTVAGSAASAASAAQAAANNAALVAADAIQAAEDAQDAADAAAADALAAAGLAGSKGKVIIQSAAPDVADRLPQNLWIDTTGGANTPKRWNGSSWVAVTDKAATDAANAAATAQSAATAAQGTANTALANAATAQTTANNAASAASAAQGTANTALTTANGKNKIVRSTANASSPGDYQAGDQWWKYSGSEVVAMWLHNGTAWAPYTLTDSVITNLSAATITAGTLSADVIGANTITAPKLVVGDPSNLILDPDFQYSASWNTSSARVIRSKGEAEVPAGAPSRTNVMRLDSVSGSNNDTTYITGTPNNRIPVSPGDVYYVDYWVARTSDCNSNFRFFMTTTDANGANSTWPSGPPNTPANIPANTWVHVTGSITVPAGKFLATLNFGSLNTASPAGYWFVANPMYRKAMQGELIVDGSVVARKIAANSVSTSKMLISNLNNQLDDPSFEYSQESGVAWTLAGGSVFSATTPRTGLNCLQIATTGSAFTAATQVSTFQVEAGERYRVEAWVRTASGTSANSGVVLRFRTGATESSVTTAGADVAVTPNGTGTTYTKITGVWEVPAGAKFARLDVVMRDTAGGKTYRVDDLALFKMATGELIVDGTITGAKIAGETIEGGNIKADTIEGIHIKAQEILTNHLAPAVGSSLDISANGSINFLVGTTESQQELISIAQDRLDGLDSDVNGEGGVAEVASGAASAADEAKTIADQAVATANSANSSIQALNQVYSFTSIGAFIRAENSPYEFVITNTGAEIRYNGTRVTKWDYEVMEVDNIRVTKTLKIGKHYFEAIGTNGAEGTVLKYDG